MRIKHAPALSAALLASIALLIAAVQPPATQPPAVRPARAAVQPADGDVTIACFARDAQNPQLRYEADLRDMISAQRLRQWHDMTSSQPHLAGTAGDKRLCDRLEASFREMGLEVQRQEIEVYLAFPVSASLSIVQPERIDLPIAERALPEDPDTANPDLTIGWNAFSGSGEVTAGVVYANYGTKEDFAKLRDLGVDCAGKIVLARYGGNFRGYKAKFAQQAGAAGLIIFTDPKDSGFTRGAVYPEGGYANESYIQRGSIITLDYPGDPLTPFDPAEEGAQRLDPDEVDLPKIPVQPIGYGAAQEILARMTGPAVPEDWAGGLPIEYRLTGGDDLRVHLAVQQQRRLARTWNVVATLEGSQRPAERIIIGAHHDAWGFGACDPTCGTIAVLEAARCFAMLAQQGRSPHRSVVFACWGAEEFGIFGSTEWVESQEESLTSKAVAYFNLDMASMGNDFGASASPSLKTVIIDATRYVPQPPLPDDQAADLPPAASVFDRWLQRARQGQADAAEPGIGNLGGGSDHVGFYCHLGIPSAGLGGSGAEGTAYHSNYDTLTWYRRFVSPDYASPRMVAQVTATTAARLANATINPLDPSRYAADIRAHLEAITRRAGELGFLGQQPAPEDGPPPMLGPFESILAAARSLEDEADLLNRLLRTPAIVAGQDDVTIARINNTLLLLERYWLNDRAAPDRPWFRNSWAATDEDSGYASWMLPMLRGAIEHGDAEAFDEAVQWYTDTFYLLRDRVRSVRESLSL